MKKTPFANNYTNTIESLLVDQKRAPEPQAPKS